MYFNKEENFPNYEFYQLDLAHIHNKMLFDTLNELLDNYRLCGTSGETYPHRLLYERKNITTENKLVPLFEQCTDKILEWSTFMCGFFKEKEDSFLQLPTALDDEIIDQIKEDRLFKFACHEINDFEQKLFENEEEEYDILFDLTEHVFDILIEDTVGFLQNKK